MPVLTRALGLARWLVRLEIGIWRSLALWVMRRRPGQRPGVRAFAYSRDLAPLMAAFILGSTLELVVVHLLLPWETIRLVADVVGIWGLLWMLGYMASVKVFPHLVADDELRIRYGATADIAVPWAAVEHVTARRDAAAAKRTVAVEQDGESAIASVAILKRTNVSVVLARPTTIELPQGPRRLTELRLYADKPSAFVAGARERLAARSSAAATGQHDLVAPPARDTGGV